MARNYPADVHIQNFITQNYDQETNARLEAYKARKAGETREDAGFDKSVRLDKQQCFVCYSKLLNSVLTLVS